MTNKKGGDPKRPSRPTTDSTRLNDRPAIRPMTDRDPGRVVVRDTDEPPTKGPGKK